MEKHKLNSILKKVRKNEIEVCEANRAISDLFDQKDIRNQLLKAQEKNKAIYKKLDSKRYECKLLRGKIDRMKVILNNK